MLVVCVSISSPRGHPRWVCILACTRLHVYVYVYDGQQHATRRRRQHHRYPWRRRCTTSERRDASLPSSDARIGCFRTATRTLNTFTTRDVSYTLQRSLPEPVLYIVSRACVRDSVPEQPDRGIVCFEGRTRATLSLSLIFSFLTNQQKLSKHIFSTTML